MKVIIAAGGSGGHIIPGLAVAELLQRKGIHVEWIGCKERLEAKLVPDAGIPIHFITPVPLRGKNLWQWFLAPWRLLLSILKTLWVTFKLKPHVVLGMGGFASFPAAVAAFLLRKPLVIHEQNTVAGLANRWLAKIARIKLQAFPDVFVNGITVGNPIRRAILALPNPHERFQGHEGKLHLLVLGGSQGSLIINETVVKAIAILPENFRPEIWHVTGEHKSQTVLKLYEQYQLAAKVSPFVEDIAKAYDWADLVITRAGAMTVSELAAAGLGSILVPYAYSIDNHQMLNAHYLADADAAIILSQHDFNPDRLGELLKELSEDRPRLLKMAQAAKALGKPEATELIVKCLI